MTKVLHTQKPNPGTKEATEKGCKCPVIDNHYGKGYQGRGEFIYNMDCPLHTANMTIGKNGIKITK